MIRYKRIYPLRQSGRLAAIVTVVGGEGGSEVTVKFKIKPECSDLMIIFFNPKTYEYEMLPLQEKMRILTPMTSFTACVIAYKRGMFIDFLMEGSISKGRLCTSKLKSIIAMDIYADDDYTPSCAKTPACDSNPPCPCEEDTPPTQEEDDEAHEQLLDYLKAMESGELPKSYGINGNEEPCGNIPREPDCPSEQPTPCDEEPSMEKTLSSSGTVPCPQIDFSLPDELNDAKRQYCEFVNPFKDRWDGVWWKVQYPDKNWHYIVGRVVVDGQKLSVLGIPGDRNTKPICLETCDMFAVDDNGIGYWLMFEK